MPDGAKLVNYTKHVLSSTFAKTRCAPEDVRLVIPKMLLSFVKTSNRSSAKKGTKHHMHVTVVTFERIVL